MSRQNEQPNILSIMDCEEADVPNCWRQLLDQARANDPELADLLIRLTKLVWPLRQGGREGEVIDLRASSFESIHEACTATNITYSDNHTWNLLDGLPAGSPTPFDDDIRPLFDYLRTTSSTPHFIEFGIRSSIRALLLDRIPKLHTGRTMETLKLRQMAQCTFYTDERTIQGRADLLLMHRNTQPWQDSDDTDYFENVLLVVETRKSRYHQNALPRLAIYLAAVQQARLIGGMHEDVYGLSTDGKYYQFWMLNSEKQLLCTETFDWIPARWTS